MPCARGDTPRPGRRRRRDSAGEGAGPRGQAEGKRGPGADSAPPRAAGEEAWACGPPTAGDLREGAQGPGRAREERRVGLPNPTLPPHGRERAAKAAAALTGSGRGGRGPGALGKMNALLEQKEQQERLREAAALGDIREVQKLVESGVDVNSQNEVNGWTCLHWACKRNHGQVVSYLLKSGADRDILTTKGEMPVQLTSRREIRKIMGVEETDDDDELPQLKKESDLPFVPNYLANPAFPFIYTSAAEDSTQLQNGGPSTPPASPPADGSPPLLPPTEPPLLGAFPRDHTSLALVQNGDISAPSAILRTPESTKPGPVCQPPVSQNRSLFSSVPSKPPVSLEPQNGTYAGPAPAFQPFFFTGAFPFNMQELVLKVRIQNPSLRENDFIEIELDRQELTYQELLRVSCCELGVNPDQVEKIRKLPNTLLRKDKDVARLQDFQELELVLMISENNFLFRNAASTLTERPCYNRRASKLTY
ncbi:Ankyrin repeat domain-containing protein 40 [Microtus ochrogaster]|uniref:Ankyrin repeat domain-containing protein 40 n=2 Tax=Microtus ochrogaster TaxID=79684 RepID=A0A8J6FZZ1_MICOH|nr:Ankyrin repeat domain-containing protein 40 [Microtus ochrogaster]